MKTGVLTFHAAHHYGAQLQAWALMRAVEAGGCDCDIIHYVRPDTEEAKRLFRSWRSPSGILANFHTLLHLSALRMRAERFERFVTEHMRLSSARYGSFADLEADVPARDAYVCGSDQIWNPRIFREQDFDPAFFAAFAKSGRKIAYAPSFGLATLPTAHHAALKSLLFGFEALSVRERSGEAIVQEATGRKAVTVLDPTLLLDASAWKIMAAPPRGRTPYLLCYFISDPAPYAPLVRETARRMGLPIVSLCGARRTVRGSRKAILNAGPREFVGWFANAAYVLTDSFHGTVFSANLGRDFLTFAYSGSGKAKVSSRLENILGILGLENRLIASPGIPANLHDLLTPMDHAAVQARLSEERAVSLGWLWHALAGSGEEGTP